jgi:hypothetical protein
MVAAAKSTQPTRQDAVTSRPGEVGVSADVRDADEAVASGFVARGYGLFVGVSRDAAVCAAARD